MALLHLATPLKFSKGIRNTSFDKQPFAKEMDCVAVGYGLTNGRISWGNVTGKL